MTYATAADIAPRLGARPFSAASLPSTTDATAWIAEAEAELLGTLEGLGIPSDYATGTRGADILRGWIANYVTGRIRQAQAAAGGDGSNEDGRDQINEWLLLLGRLRNDPAMYGAMLSGSNASPALTRGLSSHVTDPVLGFGPRDIEPVFTVKGLKNF